MSRRSSYTDPDLEPGAKVIPFRVASHRPPQDGVPPLPPDEELDVAANIVIDPNAGHAVTEDLWGKRTGTEPRESVAEPLPGQLSSAGAAEPNAESLAAGPGWGGDGPALEDYEVRYSDGSREPRNRTRTRRHRPRGRRTVPALAKSAAPSPPRRRRRTARIFAVLVAAAVACGTGVVVVSEGLSAPRGDHPATLSRPQSAPVLDTTSGSGFAAGLPLVSIETALRRELRAVAVAEQRRLRRRRHHKRAISKQSSSVAPVSSRPEPAPSESETSAPAQPSGGGGASSGSGTAGGSAQGCAPSITNGGACAL